MHDTWAPTVEGMPALTNELLTRLKPHVCSFVYTFPWFGMVRTCICGHADVCWIGDKNRGEWEHVQEPDEHKKIGECV